MGLIREAIYEREFTSGDVLISIFIPVQAHKIRLRLALEQAGNISFIILGFHFPISNVKKTNKFLHLLSELKSFLNIPFSLSCPKGIIPLEERLPFF
jgi:hypothetical protein